MHSEYEPQLHQTPEKIILSHSPKLQLLSGQQLHQKEGEAKDEGEGSWVRINLNAMGIGIKERGQEGTWSGTTYLAFRLGFVQNRLHCSCLLAFCSDESRALRKCLSATTASLKLNQGREIIINT